MFIISGHFPSLLLIGWPLCTFQLLRLSIVMLLLLLLTSTPLQENTFDFNRNE
jgi:hypothetical protein